VFLAVVVTVAVAAPAHIQPEFSRSSPQNIYEVPAASVRSSSFDTIDVVPILRDERIQEEDGRYSFDVETGNGIMISQAGSPDGPNGAVIKTGQYS